MKLGEGRRNLSNDVVFTLEEKPTPAPTPTPTTGTCSGCVGYWRDSNGQCVYTGNPPGVGGTAAPLNTTVYTGPNAESNCNAGYFRFLPDDENICIDNIGIPIN